MTDSDEHVARIAERVARWPADGARRFVAIAGPPAAGKSTLAEAVTARLDAETAGGCALVAMDGFHLDNAVLDARGWRPRKGAPHTFDVAGYRALLRRMREEDEDVFVPVFDRDADLARACAAVVPGGARVVVTEGNYLLLDAEPWTSLAPLFDLTVFLDITEAELEARLVKRWASHGWDAQRAADHIAMNDMPNIRTVLRQSRPADITLQTGGGH